MGHGSGVTVYVVASYLSITVGLATLLGLFISFRKFVRPYWKHFTAQLAIDQAALNSHVHEQLDKIQATLDRELPAVTVRVARTAGRLEVLNDRLAGFADDVKRVEAVSSVHASDLRRDMTELREHVQRVEDRVVTIEAPTGRHRKPE